MMRDIFFPPGEKIIQTDNLMPLSQQSINKMGAKKSGTACDKNTHFQNNSA